MRGTHLKGQLVRKDASYQVRDIPCKLDSAVSRGAAACYDVRMMLTSEPVR